MLALDPGEPVGQGVGHGRHCAAPGRLDRNPWARQGGPRPGLRGAREGLNNSISVIPSAARDLLSPEKQQIPRCARDDIELFRGRSEEHTSELQTLMRISYAVF